MPTICHECELEKVYVVSQVTAVFGSLIKYTVKTVQDSIKKCGIKNCNINFVNHLGFTKKFSKLHMLPDPVPGEDEHYLPFENMYGTPTTEVHRPSSSKRSKKQKTLPFVASIQHARNVNLMFQCEECGMLRLIYSKKKLTSQAKTELERKLNNFDFGCGASTSDLNLSDELSNVHFSDTLDAKIQLKNFTTL